VATTKVCPVTLFRRSKPTYAYFALPHTEAEARLGEALNALLRYNYARGSLPGKTCDRFAARGYILSSPC